MNKEFLIVCLEEYILNVLTYRENIAPSATAYLLENVRHSERQLFNTLEEEINRMIKKAIEESKT